jgi:hypothetical protein
MPTAWARPSDDAPTAEEADFGFTVVVAATGTRLVVAGLGRGLCAVREVTSEGSRYVICDETLRSR